MPSVLSAIIATDGRPVPLHQLKAWFAHRAWRGPTEYIRWQGACGHFAGRATMRP